VRRLQTLGWTLMGMGIMGLVLMPYLAWAGRSDELPRAFGVGLACIGIGFNLVRLTKRRPTRLQEPPPDAESQRRLDEPQEVVSRDAGPQDWPRYAPAGLALISLAAAGTAIGFVVAAAAHSLVGGIATALAALLGGLIAGRLVAAVRRAYRSGQWTRDTAERINYTTSAVLIVLGAIVAFGNAPMIMAAVAAFFGFMSGATAGSLFWQRSVVQAHRRGAQDAATHDSG
jgi:hypothetical protein